MFHQIFVISQGAFNFLKFHEKWEFERIVSQKQQ